MSHQPAGRACNCGQRGWMPGIEHVPIAWALPDWIRQREGKMAPVAIVDHIMQGYQSTVITWATNGQSKIITHFSIGRDGRKVQHCSVFTPGIHASSLINPVARVALALGAPVRGANTYTIGKEHEGCSERPRGYSVPDEMIWSRANPWPEPMVRSSLDIDRWCFSAVPSLGQPSRDSIIGHYEIDARNRPNDPATAADRAVWPVERKLRELGGSAKAGTHTIRAGETLGRIALRYGVATADLARWNRITNTNAIEVGAVLVLAPPASAQPSQPSSRPEDLTPQQRELLAWLNSTAAANLPDADRRRLLRLAGLPADTGAPAMTPATPATPASPATPATPATPGAPSAGTPPTVAVADSAAWEEFWRNGAEPLDYVTSEGKSFARYVVRRTA